MKDYHWKSNSCWCQFKKRQRWTKDGSPQNENQFSSSCLTTAEFWLPVSCHGVSFAFTFQFRPIFLALDLSIWEEPSSSSSRLRTSLNLHDAVTWTIYMMMWSRCCDFLWVCWVTSIYSLSAGHFKEDSYICCLVCYCVCTCACLKGATSLSCYPKFTYLGVSLNEHYGTYLWVDFPRVAVHVISLPHLLWRWWKHITPLLNGQRGIFKVVSI